MRQIAVIFILILAIIPVQAQSRSDTLLESQDRLRNSLRVFDALVMGGAKSGPVYDIYAMLRKELQNGSLQFGILEAVDVLHDGVSVETVQNGHRILLSEGILKADRTHTGLVLGFMCEGFSLVRASLRSPVKPYKPDAIQKLYDAMDALYLHALFLRDYGSATGRNFHPYEQYLMESLQNDSLSGLAPMTGAAMYILGFDAQLLYSFAELGGAVQQGILKPDEYLQKIVVLVKRLTETLKTSHQGLPKVEEGVLQLESRYVSEVSALTMLRYGVAMTNAHLARFYPTADTDNQKSIQELDLALDALQTEASSRASSLSYRDSFGKKLGL